MRGEDLKNYIAALEQKIAAAKDNKERQLQLQNDLNDALNQFHGRTLTLQVTQQKPEQETPAQAAARKASEG